MIYRSLKICASAALLSLCCVLAADAARIAELSALHGVWQCASRTAAGDQCVYQLVLRADAAPELADETRGELAIYTSSGDHWYENICYDGTIEMMDDGRVRIMMYVLDENGTATEKIEVDSQLSHTASDACETLTLELLAGEPMRFTKVDEPIAAGER